MNRNEPRGRIANANSFKADEFRGKPVAQIVAYRNPDEPPNSVEVLGIRLTGSVLWHRFFLDAGMGFWEEYSEDDVFCDFEGLERLDVLDRFSIDRPRIVMVACVGDQSALSSLTWRLDSGDLRLSYMDLDDLESPTVLIFARTHG